MINTLKIEDIICQCFPTQESQKIAYLIYPAMAEFPDAVLERLKNKFGISIIFISIPSEKWGSLLTPWPEKEVNTGTSSFRGNAAKMLEILKTEIIPQTDKILSVSREPIRNLIGVSLSGMFALWQWMECDIFTSIASLSGSFWYEGFLSWFDEQPLPSKSGKAFFLLGKKEPEAKAFKTVGINTEAIVERLKKEKIQVFFEWVDGNHFSNPTGRLERAFEFLFS